MGNPDEIKSFKIDLNEIISFDLNIINDPRFSLFQYKDVEITIKMFQNYAHQLISIDDEIFENYPSYQSLISIYRDVRKILDEIKIHFTNNTGDPNNAKIIKQRIIDACRSSFLNDHKGLPLFLSGIGSFDYVSAMKENITETLKIADDFKLKQLQVEEILKNINQKAAEADVSRYSTKFKESSREYTVSSIYWLVTSGVLLILTLTVLFLYNTKFIISDQAETIEIIKYLSTKILILTLLISATLWCAKLYKVNKNLSVVYEHKSNSLDTFTEFVNSAQSPEIKDFVLQETTKTIFNLPDTGLIVSDNLPVQSLSKVIDLAKATGGKS